MEESTSAPFDHHMHMLHAACKWPVSTLGQSWLGFPSHGRLSAAPRAEMFRSSIFSEAGEGPREFQLKIATLALRGLRSSSMFQLLFRPRLRVGTSK